MVTFSMDALQAGPFSKLRNVRIAYWLSNQRTGSNGKRAVRYGWDSRNPRGISARRRDTRARGTGAGEASSRANRPSQGADRPRHARIRAAHCGMHCAGACFGRVRASVSGRADDPGRGLSRRSRRLFRRGGHLRVPQSLPRQWREADFLVGNEVFGFRGSGARTSDSFEERRAFPR